MNTVEKIQSVIQKLKHQLAFLDERSKLFCDANRNTTAITSSPLSNRIDNTASADFKSPSSSSKSSSPVLLIATPTQDDSNNVETEIRLPKDYELPPLSNNVRYAIEKGDMSLFGPHSTNRQIIVDTVFDDIIEKYNLW
jgi:hypothetical protein